ncbi:unnamed protein product [Soboliphyme baturini]|uniref:Secreted protein n=1 Tax=Soboliphyme baturini TaxID=241478 RepID=A0A183IES8_9BILA|nr:unnamed protein product [Soboliphyme baturini]
MERARWLILVALGLLVSSTPSLPYVLSFTGDSWHATPFEGSEDFLGIISRLAIVATLKRNARDWYEATGHCSLPVVVNNVFMSNLACVWLCCLSTLAVCVSGRGRGTTSSDAQEHKSFGHHSEAALGADASGSREQQKNSRSSPNQGSRTP